MAIKTVCPFCNKTVVVDQYTPVCTYCGKRFKFTELKEQNMIVNSGLERREIEIAKDYFQNTEFLNAHNHFQLALKANKNSYIAQYFIQICEIYLNDGDEKFDIMQHTVNALQIPVNTMLRANIPDADRLKFILAMLADIKIIINNRLFSGEELYELDLRSYRSQKISDLQKLLSLYKCDKDSIMASERGVSDVLLEIADNAIAVIHKAIQTAVFGGELFMPTADEYIKLNELYKEYSKFATSVSPDYDVNKYTPDFTPNELLIEKVASRFEKYEADNKDYAKKYVINDIKEYTDILNESGKAITLTYYNSFLSLCDPQYEKRRAVMKNAVPLLTRMLLPCITPVKGKSVVDIKTSAQDDVKGKCAILNEFIKEIDRFDPDFAQTALGDFYAKLLSIMDMYFVPEYTKRGKSVNKLKETKDGNYKFYERLMFTVASSCTPALSTYVKFTKYKDKARLKLAKYCNQTIEEFLLLHDFNIEEIERSKNYKVILDIYKDLLNATES